MEHVIADKGWDDTANCRAVVKQFGAKPVIPLAVHGKGEPVGICNYQGTPLLGDPADPMALHSPHR